MNLNLTSDEITQLKKNFTAWEEIKDRASELGNEMKAIKGATATLIDGTVGQVGKLFKAMKELAEEGETEVDEISSMIEVIKHNG